MQDLNTFGTLRAFAPLTTSIVAKTSYGIRTVDDSLTLFLESKLDKGDFDGQHRVAGFENAWREKSSVRFKLERDSCLFIEPDMSILLELHTRY